MSAKQQLAEAVAALPESTSLEEAFDRLYRAFKEKLRRQQLQQGVAPPEGAHRAPPLQPLPILEGRVPQGWKDAIYEQP
jgi:hypothetical protein